ncbi:MAG: hypothetical protein M3Y82_15265, partial [Verrucomicrobiota bacterium]|nr:hypothetical protein [Verrucomicrobiota bacterium]
KYLMAFHQDERSLKKAVWMLQMDALNALSDCLELIESKRHRIAGRLFRDVVETLDLAAYFSSDSAKSRANLEKWFCDEIIEHHFYRDYIGKTMGPNAAEERKVFYRQLSKFTHRTYRALLKSYSLGAGNMMVYDGYHKSQSLVLPHTIAAYFAILAGLITQFCDEAMIRGILLKNIVSQARLDSSQIDTVLP